jgi:hypothetical protein
MRRRKMTQPTPTNSQSQPPLQSASVPQNVSQSGSNSEQPEQPVQPVQSNSAEREITKRPEPGFEVRDGDKLTVMYGGVKLGIAPYSTVELDSSIYSRILEPGDDPVEQWDKIYLYLKEQCLKVAREKLKTFSEELRAAKQRVNQPKG